MKQTPKEIRTVDIEQYFKQEKTGTYWYWRFAGTRRWNKQLTPYKEVPYVIYKPEHWGINEERELSST